MAAVERHPRNDAGRDFVVGDIHGTFPELESTLERVGFDEGRDRLFSVGDLVDRGPASADALDWMGRPWFHACRGNHEQMLIDCDRNPLECAHWAMNGGGWWSEVPEGMRADFARACRELPIAIEVDTAAGPVGIVHADLPQECTWDELVEALERGDPRIETEALWSRVHVRSAAPVPDAGPRIRHVYCGHTPLKEPRTRGKVSWIDTGACFAPRLATGRLTVVEFHPGEPAGA